MSTLLPLVLSAALPFSALGEKDWATYWQMPVESRALAERTVSLSILPRQSSASPFCPEEPFAWTGYDPGVFCSGVQVSDSVVLTARHCVADKAASDFVVRFGAHYRDAPVQDFGVASIEMPRIGLTVESDWAVLTLATPHPVPTLKRAGPLIGRPVSAFGHPYRVDTIESLPKPITSKSSGYFRAALDVEPGNSGGPVFDMKTFALLGVVSRAKVLNPIWEDTGRHCYTLPTVPETPANYPWFVRVDQAEIKRALR